MRRFIAATSVGLAGLIAAGGLAFAQNKTPDDKTQARVPLAIYTGDGFLNRARSMERDRNNRCEQRSSISLTIYDRNKIQYKSLDRADLRAPLVAEGDMQVDKDEKNSGGRSFSLARKGNNQTFSMVGQISANRGRAIGSWTVQTRFNTSRGLGDAASTCVYTFDLPKVETKPTGK